MPPGFSHLATALISCCSHSLRIYPKSIRPASVLLQFTLNPWNQIGLKCICYKNIISNLQSCDLRYTLAANSSKKHSSSLHYITVNIYTLNAWNESNWPKMYISRRTVTGATLGRRCWMFVCIWYRFRYLEPHFKSHHFLSWIGAASSGGDGSC